ncbi:MAG: alpha/beta hydrolase [Gemmatimonadales bacterium]|nr:alpha/beta hydrolase [Gemmatimonadales bacterium]
MKTDGHNTNSSYRRGGNNNRPTGQPGPDRNGPPANPGSDLGNLSLTAWDLARTRKKQPDTARGHVMTLRSHQRLVASFESERKIPQHERSFLRIKETARGSVLFIHGVSSSPGNLRELADRMFDVDFNTYVLRLPDHGTKGDTISGVPWKSSLTQVWQDYRLLARGGGKVHVVGMGFGAALALHLAAKERVSSLVLLGPALMPRNSFFQRMMVRLKLHRLPLVHSWLGWNADLIEGMNQARGKVSKIKVPIYAAHCEDDDRACPTSLRFLQRKARHSASRFRVFPDGGHAILETHGQSALFKDILKFCKGG